MFRIRRKLLSCKRTATVFTIEERAILGLKVTVSVKVAASFGGVLWVSAIAVMIAEVLMANSNFSVWCGAALLWRLGRYAPPDEGQHYFRDVSLPKSNAGGSIPPLHTIFQASRR